MNKENGFKPKSPEYLILVQAKTIKEQAKLIEQLGEALNSLRIEHFVCEDCWYSCPKSGGCCNNEDDIPDCTCGADKTNAIINIALKACKEWKEKQK